MSKFLTNTQRLYVLAFYALALFVIPLRLVASEAILCRDVFSTNTVDAFETIQKKGYFLQQNAWYLSHSQCGGTCTSVSAANNMLVMAETLRPGMISRMNPVSIALLHRRLMKEILAELKEQYGVDGTEGAFIKDLSDIYTAVFQRVFQISLGDGVSVAHSGPIDFQSILPDNGSLLILSVNYSGSDYHAVVVRAIQRLPVKPSPENPVPENFIITVSDPHAPGEFKDLKAYEHDNALYLEGYGKYKTVQIEAYGKIFEVKAGLIRDSVVINFRRYNAVQAWSAQDIENLIPKDRLSVKANVLLKDGTTYNSVSVTHSIEKDQLLFFHRFILKKSIPFDQIADIQVLP